LLVAQTYGQMVEAYMATGGLEQAASILDMLVQLEPHNEQHRTKLKWLREQKGVPGGGSFEVDLSSPAPKSSGPPLAFAAPAKPARPAGIELSGPLSADDQEFISEHLAEGRVFRKYGLGDKARDQFESVLGRFPDNLEALQELVEIFKEKNDGPAQAAKLRIMAEVHRLKGEADKAARADADADALVGPVAAPAPAPSAPVPVPVPVPAHVPLPPQRTAPPLAVPPAPVEVDMDIAVEEPAAAALQQDELEYVEMAEAAPLPPPEFDASDLAPQGEIGGQFLDEEPAAADPGFDLDEAPPAPAPFVPAGLVAQPAPTPAAVASGVPADLRRAIDEIESYVSMGFVDDARGVLGEVAGRLAAYPALVQRLAELGLEVEAPSEMDSLLGEAPAEPEPEATAEEPLQLGEGFLEFTPSTSLPTAPEPPAAAGGDGDAFDLASELGGLFGAQPAVAEAPAAAPASTDLGDASLADIFREFQKGVDKQLGKEDYETRYNLGIAYKEMGLVDEAIAEFQLAAKDEARLLECSSMLGICFIEKGMPKLAVKWFEKGLQAPGRSDEEYQGLRYDLASALEQAGESDRALALFTELYGQDAKFRDVADKARQLGG
jgi:tetratricopeptide (TPR) repeat protein